MQIYPQKAIYKKNEKIILLIKNIEEFCEYKIKIMFLEKIILEKKIILNKRNEEIEFEFNDIDLAGLNVFLYLKDKIVATTSISIDELEKIVRYGFLSDFEESVDDEDINFIHKSHLNYVQFYDWSYRHNDLISKHIKYEDMMGKKNNLDIIKAKIKSCHDFGIKTMAYAPIYASSKEFYLENKELAYYSRKKEPLTFIDVFYFMDIDIKKKWASRIIEEYRKTLYEIDFDGIHLDTYGYPKKALNYEGNLCDLKKQIPLFLDKVKKEINEKDFIFNNVGAWPLLTSSRNSQKAVYIEVWPPYETFNDLKLLIEKAKNIKPTVILAAYIEAFRLNRKNALYSALLTSIVINFNGATHLFLGENGCTLTQGYYCDYTKLNQKELELIQKYQSFFVNYQSLLFDDSLKDVTMTHCGWDNEEYEIEGEYSLIGESNKVWVQIRENERKHLLTFINLIGNDNLWNKGKREIKERKSLKIKAQVFNDVKNLYYSSADVNEGCPITLDFSIRKGKRSNIIEFEIPEINVSSIVWFEEESI